MFIKQQQPKVAVDERKQDRDIETLKKQLNNPDPKVRRWAARDLVQYNEASVALADQLLKEKEASVREVIISSLIKIADEAAITVLVECLRSDDAFLRNEAIEALKQLPNEVAPHIERLLKDKDKDIRIFTVNILESMRHPNVIKWLIDVITNDPDVNVCSTALDLLCEVANEDAIPAIVGLKERFKDEPYIIFTADMA